jgi:hypothetical protein
VSDHGEATGIVDGVNCVLDRHVHSDLALQEQPDDVYPRREGCGHLLAPDHVDAERRADLDRRSKLGDRVVVGDAENVEPDSGSRPNQVLGAHHPIAGEGMRMNLGHAKPIAGARMSARCLLHRPSVIGCSAIAFAC